MKFPLFSRKETALDRPDHAEKLLADGFRAIGQLFGRVADFIDSQRLTRQGYASPGSFLERLDGEKGSEDKKK